MIGDRVRRLRIAKDMTQAELIAAVKKAGGKLSQGQLSAIEKGDVARPSALVEMAAALETTEEYLLGKVAEVVAPQPTEAIRAPDAPLPPLRTEMPKDVPVYGTVVGGSGQGTFDFELNGTIVDYVRRPPRIAGRIDVFAAYVQGESMVHWRRPGQLIYVEKAKPPTTMDYVLVELLPASIDGPRPALVKQLLAITPTKIKLRQHNPPKDFEIERRTVLQIYRVMDWDELLGV